MQVNIITRNDYNDSLIARLLRLWETLSKTYDEKPKSHS